MTRDAPVGQASAPRSIPAPRCRSRSTWRRAGARNRVHSRHRSRRRRRTRPDPALPRHQARRSERSRGGVAVLEPHPGRGQRRHARRRRQLAGQRLAAIPDAGLPALGAQRLLPVGRRLRLPRPVAGRDGALARRAARCCASISALRRAPVPRGRRAALVAPAVGPRRAHAFLRRLPVAAAGDLPLRRRHRRYRRARRAHPVSSRAGR